MILIGMFDSPFVRRVAVSMRLLGVDFEHRNWSVGRDFDRIRDYNPLGRVPTLVLDDGETLFESAAILDFLDEQAGPDYALLPSQGPARRRALKLIATAIGAADKGVLQIYERVFREAAHQDEGWVGRCRTQTLGALVELDAACAALSPTAWLIGDRMTQADITAACVFTFIDGALALEPGSLPALRAHAARLEALPAFTAFRVPFHRPYS